MNTVKVNRSRDREVARLASRTRDAFSYDRFAPGEWKAVCNALLGRYTFAEAGAILRSRHIRHGLDMLGIDAGAAVELDVIAILQLLDENKMGRTRRGRPIRGNRDKTWLSDLMEGT